MRAGETIVCPCCGEKTIVKEHRNLDGFKVVGVEFRCMLCAGKLGDAPMPGTAAPEEAPKANPFASLLGEKTAAAPSLADGGAKVHFCRDCRHFIVHPFLSRCEKFHKEVNPMDDCVHFESKSKS